MHKRRRDAYRRRGRDDVGGGGVGCRGVGRARAERRCLQERQLVLVCQRVSVHRFVFSQQVMSLYSPAQPPLFRSVQWFRDGLVFKMRRTLYDSLLGLRVKKKNAFTLKPSIESYKMRIKWLQVLSTMVRQVMRGLLVLACPATPSFQKCREGVGRV